MSVTSGNITNGTAAVFLKASLGSIIILCVIALEFYIRNPATAFYIHGTAISWCLFALLPFVNKQQIFAVSATFAALMCYTLVDGALFNIKKFEANDMYLLGSISASGIVYMLLYGKSSGRQQLPHILLFITAVVIIAGRNYLPLFAAIGLPADTTGGVWFMSDAIAWVLAALFALATVKGSNKVTAVFFLLLTAHNLVNELMFDPIHTRASEWAMVIYIALFSVWLYFRFRLRRSAKGITRLNTVAVSFHVYLSAAIASLLIYAAGTGPLLVKLLSVVILMGLVTLVLAKSVWVQKGD